jgi:hypothetical protein
MTHWRNLILGIGALISGGATAAALAAQPTLTEERGKAGTSEHLRASAQLTASTVRLSGNMHFTVTVEGPAPLRVRLPSPPLAPASAAVWKVTPDGPVVSEPLANGRERWRQNFRVYPYAAGDAVPLAPASLSVRAGNAAADTDIAWEGALSVRVTTEVSDANLSELRPISPVEVLEDGDPPSKAAWPGLLAIVTAVVVGAGLALFIRSRVRKRSIPVDPHSRALESLHQLRQGNDYSVTTLQQIADLLRPYIEARFDVPATRLTTQELLAHLGRGDALSPELLKDLRSLLEAGDIAKFTSAAGDMLTATDVIRMLDVADAFVRQTAPPVRRDR